MTGDSWVAEKCPPLLFPGFSQVRGEPQGPRLLRLKRSLARKRPASVRRSG